MHPDEIRLVERLNRAEEDAYCELLRRYERVLRKTVITFLDGLMSADLAYVETEEIIQEVCIDIFCKGLPEIRSLQAYLIGMGRHKALDRVRRARSVIPIDYLENVGDTRPGPERELQAKEDLHSLRLRIAQFPKDDQQIIDLRCKGYTYEEIAQTLQMTLGTVKARLFRLRNRL
jgi:RNA polymerase sigma-70 factor (ECF subfamily)